jgi:NAD(P)-dependent dehydrogenase (short-subunit alcohol dehydrogenase family)
MNQTTSPASGRPTALVTGGRRGIGAAIAVALAHTGFDVAITGLTDDDAVQTVLQQIREAGGRAFFVRSDLKDTASHGELIDAVVRWNGGIHCLVNNAGIGSPVRGDLLAMTGDAFDQVIGTNLRGTFFLSQAVARQMLALDDGHPRNIITISSVSAEMASIERGEYCMSKAALAMATKLLAIRLAEPGIGVFEVRPGVIRTDMTAGVADKYEKRFAEGLVPMKRWGETGDIAGIVASLAKGQFLFASGSVINADGGLSIPRL